MVLLLVYVLYIFLYIIDFLTTQYRGLRMSICT